MWDILAQSALYTGKHRNHGLVWACWGLLRVIPSRLQLLLVYLMTRCVVGRAGLGCSAHWVGDKNDIGIATTIVCIG